MYLLNKCELFNLKMVQNTQANTELATLLSHFLCRTKHQQ